MRVLLCTPYNINPQVEQGGIAIWAQNMLNYHQSVDDKIRIDVIPFDRKAKKTFKLKDNYLSRIYGGIRDYSGPVRETIERIKTGKYDVIHLCTSASISLAKDIVILNSARKRGTKSIIHFHFGRIPELAKKRNWEWKMIKKVVHLADEVITMDMNSYKTLLQEGFKNVNYLPNPLSQKIIQQIEYESNIIKRKENQICFVGHVIPSKGVFELVEACNGIKNIKLNIIGKVTNEVQKRVELLSDGGDWITFKGEIDHFEVIRELLAAEIFALPTYTEGFPNVIIESMACGCAIVTTPVGAIPEMLDIKSDSPCGLVSNVKDVIGLRNNIIYFLDNKQEAKKYASRARKRVYELYSIPKIWKQLVTIWEN